MEKVYTIFAGVNGAGKTTLYKTNQNATVGQKRVNSDEILRENKGDWRNNGDQVKAMKEAVKRVKQYLDKGISFNQETTLAGNSIINNIKKAKENGFKVKMFYVGLQSADLAVQRVNDRVRKGGHGIEEKDIRRRYEASLKNLKTAINVCDEVNVYDNTVEFRHIASFKDGKKVNGKEKCEWLEQALSKNEELQKEGPNMDREGWRSSVNDAPSFNMAEQNNICSERSERK